MVKNLFVLLLLILVQPLGAGDDVVTPRIFTQEKKDVIVVPDSLELLYEKEYDLGAIIIVEVGETTYTNFTWQVIGPSSDPKQMFRVINDGTAVSVRSTKGIYHVFCAASKPDGTIHSQVINFTVGEQVTPPVPPVPIVDGFLGFTKVAYTNFPSGNKQLATKLAASYRLICSKVKATDTPENINELLKTENRAVTSESDRLILSSWNKAVSGLMIEKAKANLLVTPANHVEVFKAIADGLELVR